MFYFCPYAFPEECPHFNLVFNACACELDIGKPPTEYAHCEGYEPDDNLVVKEI